MSASAVVALLLTVGAVAGMGGAMRGGGWRRARAAMQVPLAALLYFALFPPSLHGRGDVLNLIAAGATKEQLRALPFGELRAALPGAPAAAAAELVPDLATALRLHPQVRRLHLIGGGLPLRDIGTAASVGLGFDPAPAHGLVELHAPATVPLGQQWSLNGRVATPGSRIELRDPAGAVVDSVLPDTQGRFAASAPARGTGAARFELHLLKAGVPEEVTSVPVLVEGGGHLSILALEGAPGAEGKYWHRWARDAGMDLGVSTGLTQNVVLRQGPFELTPERLAAADVVVIDARAWEVLPGAQKTLLGSAVEQGLGLLLRADVPPADSTATDWQALGYRVAAATAPHDQPADVVLDQALGLHDRQTFTEAPITVDAADATPVLTADDGTDLAWRRNLGRGRVGLLRLVDSYRLQLIGEPSRYGTLWAGLLAQLARPQAPSNPGAEVPRNAWVAERAVICGLGEAGVVRIPGADQAAPLVIGRDGCAAYWPAQAGWQVVQSAGGSEPFYVRASDDGAGLRAARDRLNTQLLASDEVSAQSPAATTRPVPLPRWPFLLAWLAMALATWWVERGAGRVRI